MSFETIVQFFIGGGFVALMAAVVKTNMSLQEIRKSTAKANRDIAEQKSNEAKFEAEMAASSSESVGQGFLQRLMATMAAREEEAHKNTALVAAQLKTSIEANGALREEVAELRQAELQCQATLEDLRLANQNAAIAHDREMNAIRTRYDEKVERLENRIYALSNRLNQAGGLLTATDVMPDHHRD